MSYSEKTLYHFNINSGLRKSLLKDISRSTQQIEYYFFTIYYIMTTAQELYLKIKLKI